MMIIISPSVFHVNSGGARFNLGLLGWINPQVFPEKTIKRNRTVFRKYVLHSLKYDDEL